MEWRKNCSSNTTDPAKVASALQEGARTVIDRLATLPKTDRAILNCSAVATGQVIATASACKNGNCIVNSRNDAFNQGAKAACAINSCLESFVNNPAVKAMSLTCNAGDKLASAITCNGYPGGGGGLKGLCETEIKNGKPIILQPCPSSVTTTVLACQQDGSPVTKDAIGTSCANAAANLKRQGLINELQLGNCSAKCVEQTLVAASNCKIKSCAADSLLQNGQCIKIKPFH